MIVVVHKNFVPQSIFFQRGALMSGVQSSTARTILANFHIFFHFMIRTRSFYYPFNTMELKCRELQHKAIHFLAAHISCSG